MVDLIDFKKYALTINSELVKVLEEQDHKFKGTLINSLKDENNLIITKMDNATIVEMFAAVHWKYMHFGVKPEEIKWPFAKKRIFALVNWIQVKKSLKLNEAFKAAYAIAAYHKKVGMPNPKETKTNFVNIALNRIEDNIWRATDYEIGKKIDEEIKL